MGVAPGFEHDTFVSYAHQDNEPALGSESGWVETLVQELTREVRQRLGRKEFSCWMDYQIDENRPLSDELMRAIQKSATLLIIMSPTYMNSTWCQRERNSFLQCLAGRAERGDIFLVERLSMDHETYPRELGNPKGFKFWTVDPNTKIARSVDIGVGASRDLVEQYASAVVNLSEKLAKHIRTLQSAPAATAVVQKDLSSAPRVFVARSTDDLEEREDEFRAYLAQMGVAVLPEKRYPQSSEQEFETAMLSDLATCKLYIQLLGPSRGRELDFAAGRRLAAYQCDIAERSGKPLWLWRDRELDVESVKDAAHRALLEKARACGIEEFKRAVSDEAQRAPPTPGREVSKVMVFVAADAADRELAQNVGQALQHLTELEIYYPLTRGTPEEVRTDFEETLTSCDGVLLIYGKTTARWIRSQLQQSRKVIAQRSHPLSALAVFQGPPPEDKGGLDLAIPNLVTLDCRHGIDPTALETFIRRLQSTGGVR
jgi:hypothetical protein